MAENAHQSADAESRPRWSADRVLLAILVLGAILRACYLFELSGSPELAAPAYDAAFHDHWARALLSGDWSPPRFFANPEIETTPYFRPPAYPWFLAGVYAITGGSPLGARAVQMILGLVNVWLGFVLGRALFGPAVGRLVAAGLACAWPLLYFEGELLAPVLLVTLMLGTMLGLHRWWRLGGWGASVGAGLVLGLFALARPNVLALAPVVWLWMLWVLRGRSLPYGMRAALLGLPLGLVVAVAPATIRNAVVAGDFVPITANAGVNLYIGNNPEADGYTARIPILSELATLQGWTCFDQPAIARGVERIEGRPLLASEVSAFFRSRALAYMAEHPGDVLALAARKAALFWGAIEVANNRELEIAREQSPLLRWLPGFPWLFSLALIGAAWLVRERRGATPAARRAFVLLVAAVVLVFFATHLPFFVAGRYRVPLWPLLLLFAACGIRGIASLWSARRLRPAIPWTAAWLALLVFAHVPLTDYRPEPELWHFQLSEAYRMRGEPERAVGELRLAIEVAEEPFALAHNNLGATLLQLGHAPEALEQLQAAIRAAPRYADPYVNLALAYSNTGRDDLARQTLESLIRFAPDALQARVQLAATLLRLRLPAAAVPHLEHALALGDRAPLTQYLRALALLESGRGGEAFAALEALAREHPGYPESYLLLAELAMQDGDRVRARRLVDQALKVAPGHPGARELRQRLQ